MLWVHNECGVATKICGLMDSEVERRRRAGPVCSWKGSVCLGPSREEALGGGVVSRGCPLGGQRWERVVVNGERLYSRWRRGGKRCAIVFMASATGRGRRAGRVCSLTGPGCRGESQSKAMGGVAVARGWCWGGWRQGQVFV